MDIIASITRNALNEVRLQETILAGATVLRYNCSLGSLDELMERITFARSIISELGMKNKIKIMIDLPGSKFRLGWFPQENYTVRIGQKVTFKIKQSSKDVNDFIPINISIIDIKDLVNIGDIITIADGEVAISVDTIIDELSFTGIVINGGWIPSVTGINLPINVDDFYGFNHDIIKYLEHLAILKPEWVAFSFVNNSSYLIRVKQLLKELAVPGWDPYILSKIESPLGIKNINEIIESTDGIIVARGDLALTIPYEYMGLFQREIIKRANEYGKKVIIATQILDSTINSYTPNRAEISDLTNVVLDGAEGIMLCKETGANHNPSYPIKVAKKIINAVSEQGHSLDGLY